jgi:small-conductance mechanosensitive channel
MLFTSRAPALTILLLAGLAASAQDKSSSPSPSVAPVAQDPARIIEFLSDTISWYRQLAAEQKLASEPSDITFLQENRRIADQVVQQAFEYARNQAQLQPRQPNPQPQPGATDQYQRLALALQKLEQQIQDTQNELQETRAKLPISTGTRRKTVQSQVDELQSEISLLQARRDAVESMAEFASSSSGKGSGLRAQIEELARSIPEALNPPDNQRSATQSGNNFGARTPPTGIWGLAADLIRLSGKRHTLEDELASTQALRRSVEELRTPLTVNLRGLILQGDQLFAAADSAQAAQLQQQKEQLDALTAQFKRNTAAVLPLGKVAILLGIYETTIKDWRESIRDQSHEELRQLTLRLGVLLLLIAAVFGIGEIWRRTTFRYVHDVRRRYQFLLLRRVVMWAAIVLIVILAFATQLGSAVTFAGLLTAGVAVALQNVIVSVVGYFFLIGKYGVRVGDRVQISGVTGEVVDIGLVRLHLMELGGPNESQPSGRVVAFSNSIVFQPSAGVFKQIPGTNFVWHELRLTLASETDYHTARDRITQAVDVALEKYRENVNAQRQMMERNLTSVSGADLAPKIRLHYTASGIEATVRFPVDLNQAAETDDQVMRELLAATQREPKLKLLSAEMPVIKPAQS